MAQLAQPLRLYGYYRSSAACRIRMVLNYKQLPYENIPVNLLQGEHEEPQFEKVNANKRIPVLEVGGKRLNQTIAISEYLEEAYSNPPLLPKDLIERAKVRDIVNIICCDSHPVMVPFIQREFANVLAKYANEAIVTKEKFEWAKRSLEFGLEWVENRLPTYKGEYAVGNTFTLADIAIASHMLPCIRYEVDISKYPLCKKVYENTIAMEAIKLALPQNQPDFPKS